jgi:hypothetical protein
MIFRNRMNEPKKLVPIGMMCLVAALMWPYLFHPATQFGHDLSLGVRGCLFSISIAVNLLARRRRSCGGNEATPS